MNFEDMLVDTFDEAQYLIAFEIVDVVCEGMEEWQGNLIADMIVAAIDRMESQEVLFAMATAARLRMEEADRQGQAYIVRGDRLVVINEEI